MGFLFLVSYSSLPLKLCARVSTTCILIDILSSTSLGGERRKVAGKTDDLVRVYLYFLMTAAEEVLLAREEEGGLSA
jgi:hypothetical protein